MTILVSLLFWAQEMGPPNILGVVIVMLHIFNTEWSIQQGQLICSSNVMSLKKPGSYILVLSGPVPVLGICYQTVISVHSRQTNCAENGEGGLVVHQSPVSKPVRWRKQMDYIQGKKHSQFNLKVLDFSILLSKIS